MRFFSPKNRVFSAICSRSWVGPAIFPHRNSTENIHLLKVLFLFWAQTFFSIDLSTILAVEFRKNARKRRFVLKGEWGYRSCDTGVLLNLYISWNYFFCFAIGAIFSEIQMILGARVSWLKFRIYKNAFEYRPISCFPCLRGANSRESIPTQLIRALLAANALSDENFGVWCPILLSLRFWYRQNPFNSVAI